MLNIQGVQKRQTDRLVMLIIVKVNQITIQIRDMWFVREILRMILRTA